MRLIDLEQSKELGKIMPRDGIDTQLDEHRRFFDGMEDFLDNVARQGSYLCVSYLCVVQLREHYVTVDT